jgi:hypothetical protein
MTFDMEKMMLKPLLIVLFIALSTGAADVSAFSKGGEKVHVDLPKSLFIAGEAILFEVEVNIGEHQSPSRFAYAELVDRDGQAVAQEIISLNGNGFPAYLDIPDNLISDHYLFRVYTRISHPTESPESIFHQFVTVINPKKPPLAREKSEKQMANKGFEGKAYGKNEEVLLELPEKPLRVSIAAFNPFLEGMNSKPLEKVDYQLHEHVTVPELYGHIIRAKSTRQPMDTTETFFLSVHGPQSALFTAKPNAEGDLFFDLGAMEDVDFVIIQSENWKEPLRVLVEKPFLQASFVQGFAFPELYIDESYRGILLDLLAAKEVGRYFEEPLPVKGKSPVTGIYADEVFLLDDYNRFDDFATTIREYVPKVRVRRQNRQTIFKVFDDPGNTIFAQNPLVLLDAMPVFDSESLAQFNPRQIRSMELMYRKFFLNEDAFDGVINLKSFENDFGGFPIPDQALYIPYSGSQKTRDYGGIYRSQAKKEFLPDFRTILLWEKLKALEVGQLKFHTSGVSGPFQVQISHLDGDGKEQLELRYFQVVD